MKLHKTLILYF